VERLPGTTTEAVGRVMTMTTTTTFDLSRAGS
jgi:hypothetical protein